MRDVEGIYWEDQMRRVVAALLHFKNVFSFISPRHILPQTPRHDHYTASEGAQVQPLLVEVR